MIAWFMIKIGYGTGNGESAELAEWLTTPGLETGAFDRTIFPPRNRSPACARGNQRDPLSFEGGRFSGRVRRGRRVLCHFWLPYHAQHSSRSTGKRVLLGAVLCAQDPAHLSRLDSHGGGHIHRRGPLVLSVDVSRPCEGVYSRTVVDFQHSVLAGIAPIFRAELG